MKFYFAPIIFIALQAAGPVFAAGCFDKHIADALRSNETRKMLYANESGGDTLPVSKKLIFMERVSRYAAPVIYNFDWRARKYQNKGIHIMCDEFVDMSLTPAFQKRAPEPWPALAGYVKPDARALKTRLEHALERGSFGGLASEALNALGEIKTEPRFNCMTRHMLESITRIARLAPRHVEAAKKAGLESPEFLSRDLIRSHIFGLGDIVKLDEMGAPLQARGFPILCGDVPPIEIP